MKTIVKLLVPPILLDLARGIKTRFSTPEWEYVPEGWARQVHDSHIRGWDVSNVLDVYRRKWDAFATALKASTPLGISHEANAITSEDWLAHNTLVSYAYVVALAARRKASLSILDWGGGIGHYYLISQAVLPDVEIEYHCKDVPTLCAYGKTLFPSAKFYSDETCFENRYDLVLASASLQYSENWQTTFHHLAQSTKDYLFVTRLPVVTQARSFVVLQRAYAYGYGTEYLGWFINRAELMECARAAQLELMREFIVAERPRVQNAPAPGEYRGFLFRPVHRASGE